MAAVQNDGGIKVKLSHSTRISKNITILGLGNKTDALKDAYDLVATSDANHEADNKIFEFLYND